MLPPNFRQHFWVTTKKRNCHQIKINFIEWASADTIIMSSNCLKLTKSFEYHQVDSFGIFTCDRLYVQYFVWLNHVTRYIYVYRSFKWWIFSSIYFLCNHSIPPDSWNLPVQENMYVYMYIRRKSPTKDIQDWLQSSMKVECWGLQVFHERHPFVINLEWETNSDLNKLDKEAPLPQPHPDLYIW